MRNIDDKRGLADIARRPWRALASCQTWEQLRPGPIQHRPFQTATGDWPFAVYIYIWFCDTFTYGLHVRIKYAPRRRSECSLFTDHRWSALMGLRSEVSESSLATDRVSATSCYAEWARLVPPTRKCSERSSRSSRRPDKRRYTRLGDDATTKRARRKPSNPTSTGTPKLSSLTPHREFQPAVKWERHRSESIGRIVQEGEIVRVFRATCPCIVANNDRPRPQMRADQL